MDDVEDAAMADSSHAYVVDSDMMASESEWITAEPTTMAQDGIIGDAGADSPLSPLTEIEMDAPPAEEYDMIEGEEVHQDDVAVGDIEFQEHETAFSISPYPQATTTFVATLPALQSDEPGSLLGDQNLTSLTSPEIQPTSIPQTDTSLEHSVHEDNGLPADQELSHEHTSEADHRDAGEVLNRGVAEEVIAPVSEPTEPEPQRGDGEPPATTTQPEESYLGHEDDAEGDEQSDPRQAETNEEKQTDPVAEEPAPKEEDWVAPPLIVVSFSSGSPSTTTPSKSTQHDTFSQFYLFAAPDDAAPSQPIVCLEEQQHLYAKPLTSVFTALRGPDNFLGKFTNSEMGFTFEELDLSITEDNIHASEVSLRDIVYLHEGLELPLPLTIRLDNIAPRFISRYNQILSKLTGETLEQATSKDPERRTLEQTSRLEQQTTNEDTDVFTHKSTNVAHVNPPNQQDGGGHYEEQEYDGNEEYDEGEEGDDYYEEDGLNEAEPYTPTGNAEPERTAAPSETEEHAEHTSNYDEGDGLPEESEAPDGQVSSRHSEHGSTKNSPANSNVSRTLTSSSADHDGNDVEKSPKAQPATLPGTSSEYPQSDQISPKITSAETPEANQGEDGEYRSGALATGHQNGEDEDAENPHSVPPSDTPEEIVPYEEDDGEAEREPTKRGRAPSLADLHAKMLAFEMPDFSQYAEYDVDSEQYGGDENALRSSKEAVAEEKLSVASSSISSKRSFDQLVNEDVGISAQSHAQPKRLRVE